MNFGFIGAGNMASAIFKGMLDNNYTNSKNIFIYDTDSEKLKLYLNTLDINICSSYADIINNSDILIIAVKPNIVPTLLPEISDYIKEKKILVVSIAAGITIKTIENLLGFKVPIVRVMPNINAEICLSTTAYCTNDIVTFEESQVIQQCFEAIGYVTKIEENEFAVFAAIAGCSPAYAYLFIDSLAKGAQKYGMNKKKALEIAANAVLGSAKMLANSKMHPWELIDKVCSPGGTTIEGICTLEEYKFESGIVKAVENSILKDKNMNK